MCKFKNALTEDQLNAVQEQLHRIAHKKPRPYLSPMEYHCTKKVCIDGVKVFDVASEGVSVPYVYLSIHRAIDGAKQLGLI